MTTGREPDRPAAHGRAASIRLRAAPSPVPRAAWHAVGGPPPAGLGTAAGVDRTTALERQAVATRLRLDALDEAVGELRGAVAAVAARLDDAAPAGRPSPDAAGPAPDGIAPGIAEDPVGPSARAALPAWTALPAWARVVAAVDAILLAALLAATLTGRPAAEGPRAAAPLPPAETAARP